MWQHRIMLESKSHPYSIFTTLTYSDDFLPDQEKFVGGNLIKSHLQSFIKRLRRRLPDGIKIRYFAVGEYGERSNRAHYHLCIFGLSATDKGIVEKSWHQRGIPIGHIHVGQVTKESARYIAGYTIKKLTKNGDERLGGRNPEFMLSSKRDPGGIGLQEVLRIAKTLKANEYYDVNQIINSFRICGKSYPLGGYLSGKLMDAFDVPRETRAKALWDYQQKIFNENHIHDEEYYFNIISQGEQFRRNQEKKHNIYKKEKIF